MIIINILDYNLGKLNPRSFPLQTFSEIVFDIPAIKKMGLKYFPARVIIAKDNEGHYFIGEASEKNYQQGWPIFHWTEGLRSIRFDTSLGNAEKTLDVTVSDEFKITSDQFGPVKLFKMELL